MVNIRDIQEPILYFNKFEMSALVENQRKDAEKAIQALNPDALLNTPVEDIVKDIATKFSLDVPVLLRDEAHLEEPRETTMAVQDYGREYFPPATTLTLVVPFIGDGGMFWVQP